MFLTPKALAAVIDVSIPCVSCAHANDASPVGLIANFYELAIAASGVLALGMIIYAGIIRIIYANTPGKVSESNDIIYNALLGIVLLFGAYILLNTINPQLTKLELPKLSEIKKDVKPIVPEGTQEKCGYPDKKKPGSCPESSVPLECSINPAGEYSCSVKSQMVWTCKANFKVGGETWAKSFPDRCAVTKFDCSCSGESACDKKFGQYAISGESVQILKSSCTNL